MPLSPLDSWALALLAIPAILLVATLLVWVVDGVAGLLAEQVEPAVWIDEGVAYNERNEKGE